MKPLLLILVLGLACVARAAEESKSQRDARMKWWREARFGIFVHFGLYAIPAGQWNGKRIPGGGEWIMNDGHIPLADYEKLKDQFNPDKFDAKEWVKLAREAGMKYLVVTSKHHDGFCLWPSKQTDYTIANTPFKRDLLKELADACKADGTVRFCVYYSIMDWHHPDAQSVNAPNYNPSKKAGDYKPNPSFRRYVETYLKPQLKELIETYDPGVIWFDGEWIPDYTEAMGKDVDAHCRTLNPKIIVNNRVGKSRKGMAGMSDDKTSPGDFGTPEQTIPAAGLPGVDFEACMTMNDTWGYKRDDTKWKSAQTLVRNLADVVGKGGNYLLNVGPMPDGQIPPESADRLRQIGTWARPSADWLRTAAPGAATPPLLTLKQSADGGLTMLASDAQVHAQSARLERKGNLPYNIGYWTNVKDTVSWDVTIDKPGQFTADLEYSVGGAPPGSEIAIEFGNAKTVPVTLPTGKDFLDFKTMNLGTVDLPAGPMTVTLRPVKKSGVAVMDLRRIDLRPAAR